MYMTGSTNLDRDLEAQSLEIISPPHGAHYDYPSSHPSLTTIIGDVGGGGRSEMNTGQSGVEDMPTSALPSAADPEIDLEAQPGIAPVPGKSSPSLSLSLLPLGYQSDRLTFLQMQGEGSEGQVMGTHASGDDARESLDAPSDKAMPAWSQDEIETQAHGQADADQGVCILSTAGSLDNLMRHEETASLDGGQSSSNSSEGPPIVRMIGDFDDGANALWTLYGRKLIVMINHVSKHSRTIWMVFSYSCVHILISVSVVFLSPSHRLVYSLLPSPHSPPIAFRTCSQAPPKKLHTT
jgi:hypothetical protein